METLNALQSRRNVRTYQDRPIPKEDLETILEAGRRSPSSKNEQRWDPAQFAIELAAGSIQELNLEVENKIALDLRRLKALAR